MKTSDIISLNASYNGRSPLLDKKKLNVIKKNSILINTSRAELLDYKHLHDMIIKDRLAGIGLDVYSEEPYKGKFINQNKNIILTPHRIICNRNKRKMEEEAINSVLKYLNGNKNIIFDFDGVI